MIASFLIGLREGLEAALVVSILIAYAVRIGRRNALGPIWIGVALAGLVSLGVGAVLTWGPYGLSFQAQEILGGALSIAAVALVTWMIVWMARTARGLKHDLEHRLDEAIGGGTAALVALAALSVGREGIETALFIWAAAKGSVDGWLATLAAFVGLAVAAIIGWLIYRGAVRINLGTFFTVTGYLLIVVAAGVLAYGIGDLQEAGVLAGWAQPAFDISAAVPPGSWYGTLLAGVFNFTPAPTWLQTIAWLLYVAVFMPMFALISRRPPAKAASARPATPVQTGATG